MAEFVKSCTLSYHCAVVNIALSCAIFKLVHVEEYRDLEITHTVA